MKEIELTQGKVALVDDEDYEWLSQRKWHTSGNYARRCYHYEYVDGRKKKIYVPMHREIMNADDDMVVDHINGNTFDNQKHNLRMCTHKENMTNQSVPKNSSTNLKGVHPNRKGGYIVRIVVDGTLITIGTFDDKIAGANAYNHYATMYFGEYARLNNVEPMCESEWKMHMSEKKEKTSKYKGVNLFNKRNKWLASMCHKGKRYSLGLHDSQEEAVIAWNKKAIELGLDPQEVVYND